VCGKSVRGQPGGQPVGGVGAAELLFGRLTGERPGRALASRRAAVAAAAAAAIADCVWTAADGTPLYRVTRARSMVTKMAIARLIIIIALSSYPPALSFESTAAVRGGSIGLYTYILANIV